MSQLSTRETAHIRISHVDVAWINVIDAAKVCFPIQIVNFTGIRVQ